MRNLKRVWIGVVLLLIPVITFGAVATTEVAPSDTKTADNTSASTGLSLQGTTSGGSVGGSEVSGPLSTPDHSFSIGDIELTQGIVQLNDVDLALPGYGGLDVVISRYYRSNNYQSDANIMSIASKNFGCGIGTGWGLSCMGMAYVGIDNRNKKRQVVIEMNGETETYSYDYASGSFKAKNPNNHNYVVVTFQKSEWNKRGGAHVYLFTTTGQKFSFETVFLEEAFSRKSSLGEERFYEWFVGLMLTEISSITTSKKIMFEYGSIDPGNLFLSLEGFSTMPSARIMPNFFNPYSYKYKSQSRLYTVNLSKIKDTYGREIVFSYGDNQNQNTNIIAKQFQVTGISYKNTNGGTNLIKYGYDTKGCLTSVQVNSLPAKQYSYVTYSPDYVFTNYMEKHSAYEDYYLEPAYPEQKLPYFFGEGVIEVRERLGDYKNKMGGNILESSISTLGGKVSYQYKDCIVYVPQDVINQLQNGGGFDHYYSKPLNIPQSFPVVSKKTISATFGDYSYQIDYAGYSTFFPQSRVRFQKTAYSPSWNLEQKNYYFKTAIVRQLNGFEEDKFYEFDEARPTKVTQGVNASVIKWEKNGDYVHKTREELYKNGKRQSYVEYSSYDAYNNPKEIHSVEDFVGSGLALSSSLHISKRLLNYLYETTPFPSSLSGKTDTEILKALGSLSAVIETRDTDLQTMLFTGNKVSYTSKLQPENMSVYYSENDTPYVVKTLTYDDDGRVKTETVLNATGGTTVSSMEYTLTGTTLKTMRTVNGKTVTQEQETYTGKVNKITDANNASTTMTYDDVGRVKTITYPDSTIRSWDYSSDLKKITETKDGQSVAQTVDNWGRVESIDRPFGQDDASYKYYFGNLPSEITDGKSTITYTYDKYLRKKTVAHNLFGTTSYDYDDVLNTLTITDPLGRKNKTTVNQLGQVSAVSDIGISGQDTERVLSYIYDGAGRTTDSIDGNGTIRTVDYYGNGAVKNSYYPGSRTESKYSNVYYSNGQLQYTMVGGTRYSPTIKYGYVYDAEGRTKTLSFNDVVKESYTYDETTQLNGLGKLTTVVNEGSKSVFDYDKMGRVISEKKTNLYTNDTTTLAHGYTTFGAVETVDLKDSSNQVQYGIKYVYDTQLRLQEIQYKGQSIAKFTYLTDGKLDYMVYGNGVRQSYTYNGKERVKDMTLSVWPYASSTQTYDYDTTGVIASVSRPELFKSATEIRGYGYTGFNELKTVQKNAVNLYGFKYDKTGNEVQFDNPNEKNVANQFVMDKNNQITSRVYGKGGKLDFTYDREGNMVTRKATRANGQIAKTTTYGYNYQNQPTTVQVNGTAIAQYGYDVSKQRIYKKTTSTGEERVYNWDAAGHIITEGPKANPYEIRYIYLGNEKLAMIRNGDVYYFINTMTGTPDRIMDKTGKIVQKIQLDEWGRVEKIKGPFRDEINFTGKKLDKETGLYYFNQRYYDPELGRFIQEDPAGQGLNAYAYCGNNPCVYVDPDGQTFFEALAMAGALIGGAVRGFESSSHGGNFMDGFVRGAIGGIQIGGTIGLIADLAAAPFTGGATIASWYTPLGAAVFSSYGYSWNGMLGTGGSVEFGGGSNSGGMGGSINLKYSIAEDKGTYLSGTELGLGNFPGTGEITSVYGWRYLNGKLEFHGGVDFAPGDGIGRAQFAGIARVGKSTTFGNYVEIAIKNQPGRYTLDAHFSRISVENGSEVYAGQEIGILGNSGASFGVHLHHSVFTYERSGKRHFYDPMKPTNSAWEY